MKIISPDMTNIIEQFDLCQGKVFVWLYLCKNEDRFIHNYFSCHAGANLQQGIRYG